MSFLSARFPPSCLNCREDNGKRTHGDMVLLAAACPPPSAFLCLALDKLLPPPPLRSSHAPAAGNRSSGDEFKALKTPPLGQPRSHPDLLLPHLAGFSPSLGRRWKLYPGGEGKEVLNPNKPPGLVLGTLPGILLPSSGAGWK